MLQLLEEQFGSWRPAPGQPEQPLLQPKGPPPAVPAGAAAGDSAAGAVDERQRVYLIDRPGLTQACCFAQLLGGIGPIGQRGSSQCSPSDRR
jgi:hypothetical protein